MSQKKAGSKGVGCSVAIISGLLLILILFIVGVMIYMRLLYETTDLFDTPSSPVPTATPINTPSPLPSV